MATASDLPIELHAEIIKFLHHFKDRRPLLSTALVNKDWCNASQLILFGTFTDHWYYNFEEKSRVMYKHMRFLQTITDYPQRLGPLVRSYAQDSMASNPAAMEFTVDETPNYDLWVLTAKTLPAMINLKHLYFNPSSDRWPAADNWISSATLLRSFNFQLETLMWTNFYHPPNGLTDFLQTQNNLIHLENGHYPNDHILPWLPDDLCPHLISVSGGYGSLIHIARRRKIIAWKCDTDDFTTVELVRQESQDSSALDSLRYLSVCDYNAFRAIVGPVNLNIILLELRDGSWEIDTIASLANMPKLRFLVLIHSIYTATDQEITQGTAECLGRLPSMEYIILRTSRRSGNEYCYMKLSLAPDSTGDLLQEELRIDFDVGAVWWTLYNV